MAIHTILSKEDIIKILKNYNILNLENFNGIQEGIENTNYLIETKFKKLILTIFEERVDVKDVPFYLDLMNFVKSVGINCPTPLKDENDNRINSLGKKKYSIFTFVEGKSLSTWNKNDCYEIGQQLGKFHSLTQEHTFKKENNFSVQSWVKIFSKCSTKINNIIPDGYNLIKKEINYLEKEWYKEIPFGIIHADLFPDNVLFKKNKVSGIIDFYFSCIDYWLYDLSIVLNAWSFVNGSFIKDNFINIIKGYTSIRNLTNNEKKYINIFLRGSAMRFLLTRLNDKIFTKKKSLTKIKNPLDFFEILNFHINNPDIYEDLI